MIELLVLGGALLALAAYAIGVRHGRATTLDITRDVLLRRLGPTADAALLGARIMADVAGEPFEAEACRAFVERQR
jgi:hypothetical protein